MKKIYTEPFDRFREPPKQNLFFMPFIWGISKMLVRSGNLKIHKEKMEGLKPPFLVLGTHHSFADFYITPLALFPYRANYISELEGFEYYGEALYRQTGCIGSRKFVNDMALVKNIKRVVDRGDIIVIYPEARYANVGTTAVIPKSVGKLAKMLDVPLVTINMKGNYLQSPIWNLKKRKGVKLETTIVQQFTREELRSASVEEINERIKCALTYDEYRYQFDNGIRIDAPFRAEGLEKVLYKCKSCGAEFDMKADGAEISCGGCGSKWFMNELGQLESIGTEEKVHIPDWYEWQRCEVEDEIKNGKYLLDVKVRIEALPNAKNFVDLGEGRLRHNEEGFFLTFREYGEVEEKTLKFGASGMVSIHTEYNYRGKGQCVVLSTLDNSYFIFPIEEGFNATRIQFATEYLS